MGSGHGSDATLSSPGRKQENEMKLGKLCLAVVLVGLSGSVGAAQTTAAHAALRRGNEKYAQALYNIGVCYYELWRTEDAIVAYRLALKAGAGRYARAAYALGVALEDADRPGEAQAAYRQAITADVNSAPAYYRLALLVANRGDYKAAADLFREAIGRGQGPFPTSHSNLGVMLALTGHLREAESEFELALQQTEGTFPEASYNLRLCRSLLAASPSGQLGSLQMVATAELGR
jgi:tetratricopeptide (TPR) repeat protein